MQTLILINYNPHTNFSSRDILMRVIAQNLPPTSTPVEKVLYFICNFVWLLEENVYPCPPFPFLNFVKFRSSNV